MVEFLVHKAQATSGARKKRLEKKTMRHQKSNTSTNPKFEVTLFKAADKLRGSMEPSDYKHVVLGLIFLKYISDSFEARRLELSEEYPQGMEDPDEYRSQNVFWVPEKARWSRLKEKATERNIGSLIDRAMLAIEEDNQSLKGVLSKDYSRPALNSVMLGELIALVSTISTNGVRDKSRDVLGQVYEYFLGEFAGSEGKRGGEFYTPRSVVRTLVEILEPLTGRIYDPCCGSGGMFVQSEKFVESHEGGGTGSIAIYGQESNHTTWRLCKMNLAVRGIDADVRWNSEGSFHKDELPDLRADYILANPPFNTSDWGGERLEGDVRWEYGIPPIRNANFAWLQHILYHLSSKGTAGVVLSNGSLSSIQSGMGDIRKEMIKRDVVDCIISLPGQLFYSTQIPACLWILAKNKANTDSRNRSNRVLFIDARKFGKMIDRTRKKLTKTDIEKISSTYWAWRRDKNYTDVEGFCRSAKIDEIRNHDYILTPSRYVGTESAPGDDIPFSEKLVKLKKVLNLQFDESEKMNITIRKQLKGMPE